MNILIAIDSSATAQAALAATLAREWPACTEFRILTVLPQKGRTNEHDSISRELYDANRALDEAISKIETFNPDSIVMGHLDVGDPAKCILKLAESWPANLIVLGSKERGPVERIFSRSVSRTVLQEAGASVLVARNIEEPAEVDRILVVVDESYNSRIAVDSLLASKWPKNTLFKLVCAAEIDRGIYAFQPNGAAYIGAIELHKEYLYGIRETLDRTKARIEDRFGPGSVECVVTEGTPVQVVLDVAKEWEPHLIVVGSDERPGLTLKVFGSLSQTLALKAPCSVQAVRMPILPIPSGVKSVRRLQRAANF